MAAAQLRSNPFRVIMKGLAMIAKPATTPAAWVKVIAIPPSTSNLPDYLFYPNALAGLFTFEKANCLSLLGVEELMRELKGRGTCRAVKKPISRPCLSIVAHFCGQLFTVLAL